MHDQNSDDPGAAPTPTHDVTPVDLSNLTLPITPDDAVEPGHAWIGPAGGPLAAFGPGTRGGWAEAGWFDIGAIGEDGITFTRTREN